MKPISRSIICRATIAAFSIAALTPVVLSPMGAQAKSVKKVSGKKKVSRPSGLVIKDLKVGKGKVARAGQKVTVHYRGTLTNGTEFDQSYKRGQAFNFRLGAGEVIKGWDRGVAGMRVGGKRKLTIPPSLGYGATGAGGVIPPNATLVFVVELLKVGA